MLVDRYLKVVHRVIDPAILFYRDGDKHLPDLDTCLKRASIKAPDEGAAKTIRNALDDDYSIGQYLYDGRWKLIR